MSNMRLIKNMLYGGFKNKSKGHHRERSDFLKDLKVVVIPSTKKDLSSAAMDFYKQMRKRNTGERKHERMLALPAVLCKLAKRQITEPTQEELDRKFATAKFRNMLFGSQRTKGV